MALDLGELVLRLGADTAPLEKGLDRGKKKSDEFGKGIAKNEQHIRSLSTAAGALGLALAAGVGVAIKTAADFDAQMSTVAATGDDAKKNIDALRDAAIDMGARTAFSAVEAAQGIEELGKAGISSQDILGGGLKGALDLAAAGQLSVAEAAEISASALTQFNLKGGDVPHVADLLAAGAGKAQGSVHDLGEALNQSGLVAAQTGLSIEETTGTLAAFASAGLTGSDAGTSFKQMLLALTPNSEAAATAMKDMGFSAYDAQGNFKGMTAVAADLREGLKGMTAEQQAATLKTIFGSDAIRAASIIYDQGAQGIGDWIDKTNDAGFAAETAATKLDNLKGDLEALGGSVETALIGLGSAGQGPLRDIVGGLTDLVNKFNELDEGPKQALLFSAAALAGLLLAGAGIAKLVVGINSASVAIRALGIAGLGPIAIGAAAGLAALSIASAKLDAEIAAHSAGVDGYANSLTALGESQQQLDEDFASVGDSLALVGQGVDSTSSAFEALAAAQQPVSVGLQAIRAIIPPLGVASSTTGLTLRVLTDEVGKLDDALVKMKPEDAAEAFRELSAEATAAGISLDDQLVIFDDYKASLEEQATALDVSGLSAKEYADWMGGKMPPAIQAATIRAREMKTANDKLAGSHDDATTSAEKQAEELDTLRDKMNSASSAALKLSGSQIGVEAAIDDARKALKENGKTLDINTEKGRANRTALDNIAAASLAHKEALEKQGASTKDVTTATEKARKKFIAVADQMGLTKKEAKKLAEEYGLVPTKVDTKFATPGITKSKQEAAELDEWIRNLKNKTVRINYSAGHVTSDGKIAVPGGGKYAEGGHIHGPGTGTSDEVPIWASNDEFMIKEKSARKIGYDALAFMNEYGELPKFAGGGRVSRDADIVTHFADMTAQFAAANRAVEEKLAKEATKRIMEGGGVPLGSNALTSYKGGTFTENFANRLKLVNAIHPFSLFQGGFRPATSYSGTSHAGDALDVGPVSSALVSVLRQFGVAAWDRTGKGNWAPHIHGVPLPYAGKAGGSAIWQAQDYLRGGDGLKTGTLSATRGIHEVAEEGAELVVNPQMRRFKGGERVFNAKDTEALMSGRSKVVIQQNFPASADPQAAANAAGARVTAALSARGF